MESIHTVSNSGRVDKMHPHHLRLAQQGTESLVGLTGIGLCDFQCRALNEELRRHGFIIEPERDISHISIASGQLVLLDLSSDPETARGYAEQIRTHGGRFLAFCHAVKPAWLQWINQLDGCGCLSWGDRVGAVAQSIVDVAEGRAGRVWSFDAGQYLVETSSGLQLDSKRCLGARLSDSQFQVFLHLATGMSVKEVARILEVSPKSIDCHKFRIMKKLNIHDRVHLSRLAIREGWIYA